MQSGAQEQIGGVEAFIRQAAPHVRPVLRELREIVREQLPGAKEEIKWGRPVYSLSGIVCYLAAAGDHASLGFYRGVELDDPHGILEGGGKKLRHLKVYRQQDIQSSAFESLLREAARLDRA